MAANESRERSVPSESSRNTGSGARGHGARNDPPRHIPQRQESNSKDSILHAQAQLSRNDPPRHIPQRQESSSKDSILHAQAQLSRNDPPRHIPQRQESSSKDSILHAQAQLSRNDPPRHIPQRQESSSKDSILHAQAQLSRNDPPRHIPQRQESSSKDSILHAQAQLNTYADRHNDRSGGFGLNAIVSLLAPAAVNHPAPKHEDRTERYRRQRDEAETLVESMKSELTKLEQELSAQQDAVLETKESATRVRLAMQDKELFIGPQALDRIVQEKFITLFKNVRTSSRFLNGGEPVNLLSFKPEVRKQFDIIAPGLDDAGICNLLNGKSTRRYFLQGWIALVMTERLFPTLPDEQYPGTDTKDLWLEGSQAGNLRDLERALSNKAVNPKDLNDWRAYSASLLWKSRVSDNFPASTHDYMWKLCGEIMETAGIWCPDHHERDKLAAELFNIFSEAVHFVRLLRVQRAQWSLRFPKPHNTAPRILLQQGQLNSLDTKLRPIVMFDESTMRSIAPHDDDERTDNKFVQIFIRPALFKRGDTDGEKFGVFSCIDASVIMWGELQIHHALPQQSPPNPKKPSPSLLSMSEIAGPESSRDPGYETFEMED
ncbi:hypothetical protein HYFRA_00014197 [Hymenoscyphus fraxineus]|uniref:Uncharacterized protein n=1 Tax=Hymenoscyphus fraxineus TaxID=746836 RepID=A0A9N9Q257_9HELO|nr:hypothetical protein HYFRA_00014197 [Hymenoscyphus fraxineus]